MSLALGFGVAFIFESVSQTFLTHESVEKKLSVPLLATLEHRKNKEV
jgi:capsular polysaccharide biosynthesis protein